MPWTWRYERTDGAVVGAGGLQEAIFANQGDAESWLEREQSRRRAEREFPPETPDQTVKRVHAETLAVQTVDPDSGFEVVVAPADPEVPFPVRRSLVG